MATRSGSVDPGLILWLIEHAGIPPGELADALEHRSGLRGLIGREDMQAALDAGEAGDSNARLGLAVYIHRLRAGIASMVAAMDGLDTLVFTGGVGENSPVIRRRATDGFEYLGVTLDSAINSAAGLDAEIGAPGAPVRVFVIRAREDLEISRGVRAVLDTPTGNAPAI
jgi:acetate kinase